MQGKRVDFKDGFELPHLSPGDYGKDSKGRWWASCPVEGGAGCMLTCPGENRWTVVEHEDGSITVSPSIALMDNSGVNKPYRWHGFLERGIWREC